MVVVVCERGFVAAVIAGLGVGFELAVVGDWTGDTLVPCFVFV